MRFAALLALLLVVSSLAVSRAVDIERADESAEEGTTLEGQARDGAAIRETVYDRIAASAKGQVQKKQIDSKGSTIIVDNTNGLATIINGKTEEDELRAKKALEEKNKKKNESKFKRETEDQKKRDEQLAQAKKERQEEDRKKKSKLTADQIVTQAKDREKRADLKAREKKAKEQHNKNFIDFTGLCTVASTCPPSWENKGLAGLIVHKRHESSNNFRKGEEFNTDWRWMHPYLCCATGKESRINDLFVFNKQCPKGTKNQGMAGIIMVSKKYDKNPFHNGGQFNNYWRWAHPYACQTPSSKAIKNAGSCLFSASCPAGWRDVGYGGLLIHKNYYPQQPFHKGGEYNESWTWAHPRVCCL